jgi:hypothetical protein
MSQVIFDDVLKLYVFQCPHCHDYVQVSNINCKIFRHAVFKKTMLQIPPHSNKQVCDTLLAQGKVYGCAKPFIFDGKTVTATNTYN